MSSLIIPTRDDANAPCKISYSIFTPVGKSPLIVNHRVILRDAGQTCTEYCRV